MFDFSELGLKKVSRLNPFYWGKYEQIDRIGRRLGTNIKIDLFKGEFPNAMAYVDNDLERSIGVTLPLLSTFSTKELYFVIAHEIGHHELQHLIVRAVPQILQKLLEAGIDIFKPEPSFWDWILGRESKLENVLETIKDIIFVILGIGFNLSIFRQQELEADEFAVKLLKDKGLPLNCVETFFSKLEDLEQPESIWDLLLVIIDEHPHPQDRLENLIRKFLLPVGRQGT